MGFIEKYGGIDKSASLVKAFCDKKLTPEQTAALRKPFLSIESDTIRAELAIENQLTNVRAIGYLQLCFFYIL